MLFKLFAQGHHFLKYSAFGHSSTSLFKGNCSLLLARHISTLCKSFSAESALGQGIQTVHVLMGETKCIQFM